MARPGLKLEDDIAAGSRGWDQKLTDRLRWAAAAAPLLDRKATTGALDAKRCLSLEGNLGLHLQS